MHQITKSEINKVETLGFHIENLTSEKELVFISRFQGLELHQLTTELSDVLVPLTDSKIDRLLILNDPPPSLSIQFIYTDIQHPEKHLIFSRKFELAGELSVKHEYFDLPPSARNKGVGKMVLGICLKHYLKMGVVKILVHAGLQDGGYVWARAGFKATKRNEMQEILRQCQTKLSAFEIRIVQGIFEEYYNREPNGTAFSIEEWSRLHFMEKILKGSTWHGAIDLSNTEEINNFSRYVS